MKKSMILHVLPCLVLGLAVTGLLVHAEEPGLEQAETLSEKAVQASQKGRYDEAIRLGLEVLEIRERVLGPKHPKVAWSLGNLGLFYLKKGDFKKAEPFLIRSLAIRKEISPPDHMALAHGYYNLGSLYKRMKAYEKAEPLLVRALEFVEKRKGEEHQYTVNCVTTLASVVYAHEKYDEAIRLYKKALAVREKRFGQEDQRLVSTLNRLGRSYREIKAYEKAESIYRRVLAICKKNLGPAHPDLADTLNTIGNLRAWQGDYAGAVPFYRQALDIGKEALGPDHTEVALYRYNLGYGLFRQNDLNAAEVQLKAALSIYGEETGREGRTPGDILTVLAGISEKNGRREEAVSRYTRAAKVFEKNLGPQHPDVADTLTSLSTIHGESGDYRKSFDFAKQARSIFLCAYGEDHPKSIRSLKLMGMSLARQGRYGESEKILKRIIAHLRKAEDIKGSELSDGLNALALVKNKLGKEKEARALMDEALALQDRVSKSAEVKRANILFNQACQLQEKGEFEEAMELLGQAEMALEKESGPDHPYMAHILQGMGTVYADMGNFSKAAPFFERALEIWEKAKGRDHPDLAQILVATAGFFLQLGDLARVEQLYKRALAIQEKSLGPDHINLAQTLQGMASLHFQRKEYDKVEPFLKRALAIREGALGPDHPDVGGSLNTLAIFYSAIGRHQQAAPVLRRAIRIMQSSLGLEHPRMLAVLFCQGYHLYHTSQYDKAYEKWRQLLAILKKLVGSEHPYIAKCLYPMAMVQIARGQYDQARDTFRQAHRIEDRMIDHVMGFTTEERKILFLSRQMKSLYQYMNFVQQFIRNDPSARREALDLWLRRKGIILDAQRHFQEALMTGEAPEALEIFQGLGRVRTRLSRLVFSEQGTKTLDKAAQGRMESLKKERDRLEAELSRLSGSYAREKKRKTADSVLIARTLPPKTALVEFARVDTYDFTARDRKTAWHPPHFYAFVLKSGEPGHIQLIDLGDSAVISRAVFRFKKAVADGRGNTPKAVQSASRSLYDQIFRPVEQVLGPIREVFLSPDGVLNLVPFETLQGPTGRYLVEDFTFNYLAAGRDLAGFGDTGSKSGKSLVIGDPDFEFSSEKEIPEHDNRYSPPVRSTELDTLQFQRLPGTRDEARAVHQALGSEQADLFLGSRAVEEVLYRAESPEILHLATHGFFLSDQPLLVSSLDVQDRGIHTLSLDSPHPAGFKGMENPLLRSGIVLAGANRALRTGAVNRYDGIVTAEKILGLRLRGTEMVVLSACETGLGEVRCGEGVFGLRRAFTQAGAKSLVMSMWSVPDRETKELMVRFYENMLKHGLNRCRALRQAVLKEMEAVRKQYGRADPYYWGAFVFMGNPGR